MNTCVSWLLLLSYAALAGFGGTGIALIVCDFGGVDPGPPLPPPEDSLEQTTTTPSQYYWNGHRDGSSEEMKDYVYKTQRYASIRNDPKIYLAVPSGAAVVTSALILMAGLCSRKIFTTTVSLYSSLGLFLLTLGMQLYFQVNFTFIPDVHHLLPAAAWVIGVHVAFLLLLSLQIALGMWELRRQKADWPTINFMKLFTLEVVLLALRITAAAFVTGFFVYSAMVRGLTRRTDTYTYESPMDRYPIWLSIPAAMSLGYTLVATGEDALSFFLGIQHKHLTWITSVLSALCYGFVAVVASPVFIRGFIGEDYYYYSYNVMIASTIASIVAFLYTLACWFFPGVLRTPPKFVRVAAEKLSTLSLSDIFENGISTEYFSPSIDAIQSEASQLTNKMWKNPVLMTNFISTVASVILMIILGISWNMPMYESWGGIILLAVDLSVLFRSFPPLVIQVCYSQAIIVPFAQRVVRHALELVAVFIGSISIFSINYGYEVGFQTAAALNFIGYIILTGMLMLEYNSRKKAASASLGTTQLLEEEEGEDEGRVGAESGTESESEATAASLHDQYTKDLMSVA